MLLRYGVAPAGAKSEARAGGSGSAADLEGARWLVPTIAKLGTRDDGSSGWRFPRERAVDMFMVGLVGRDAPGVG